MKVVNNTSRAMLACAMVLMITLPASSVAQNLSGLAEAIVSGETEALETTDRPSCDLPHDLDGLYMAASSAYGLGFASSHSLSLTYLPNTAHGSRTGAQGSSRSSEGSAEIDSGDHRIVVPEPAGAVALATGLVGLAGWRRKR